MARALLNSAHVFFSGRWTAVEAELSLLPYCKSNGMGIFKLCSIYFRKFHLISRSWTHKEKFYRNLTQTRSIKALIMRFFPAQNVQFILYLRDRFYFFPGTLSRAHVRKDSSVRFGETLINLKNVSLSVSRSAFAPPSTSLAHILVIFHVYRKEKKRKRELRQQQEFFMVYDDALTFSRSHSPPHHLEVSN